jgi:hypothetical protein
MPDVSMRAERVEGAVARRWFSPAIFSEPDQLGCGSYRGPRWYAVRFGQINELPDRTDDSINRRSASINAGMPSATAAGLSYVRPLPAP